MADYNLNSYIEKYWNPCYLEDYADVVLNYGKIFKCSCDLCSSSVDVVNWGKYMFISVNRCQHDNHVNVLVIYTIHHQDTILRSPGYYRILSIIQKAIFFFL